MAYVGTHRALRPLPLRYPAITSAASAAVLGIGFAAFGITALGSSSDSPPPSRLTIPGDQAIADGGTSPSASTPGPAGGALPGGSPVIAPDSQESTGTTRSPGTGTTTRTRRATVTTSAGGTNVTSTQTRGTTRSTRTTTRAQQVTSTKAPPPVVVTPTPVDSTTTTSDSTTTTTDSGVVQPGAGDGN